MYPELRDEIAATLDGDSKNFFLGMVEVLEVSEAELSENAKITSRTPYTEIPAEAFKALIEYTNKCTLLG